MIRRWRAVLRDFLAYVRAYRRLRHFVSARVVSLDDFNHRFDETLPPGQLGRWCLANCRGRFQQLDHDLWAFSHKGDAERFAAAWARNAEGENVVRLRTA